MTTQRHKQYSRLGVFFAFFALGALMAAPAVGEETANQQPDINKPTARKIVPRTVVTRAGRAKVISPAKKTPEAANAPTAAPTTPTAPPTFDWAGEELYYSVTVNGVEAVRAAFRAGDVRFKDGHPYVAISGTAQSVGIFNNIYPVDDRAHTYLNPTTLKPLRSEKFFDENGVERTYHVDFVHSTYQAKVNKTRKGKRRGRFTKPIPGTTNDMFTWFYELRSHRGKLEVGQKMSYYIYDGWRLYRLDATVVKREDVWTPMGWWKAYKIDFNRESLRTHRQKNSAPILKVSKPSEPSGSLWISRDENMIPIKVAVATQWGVGEATILKYKPATK